MGSSEYGLRRVVAFTPEEEEANRSYETSPAVRNELSYAIRSERDPNKRAVLEQSYQQDFGEPSGAGGMSGIGGGTFDPMAAAFAAGDAAAKRLRAPNYQSAPESTQSESDDPVMAAAFAAGDATAKRLNQPKQRGALAEVGRQLVGGLASTAPKMVNQALQAFSPAGSQAEEMFKNNAQYWGSEEEGWKPDMEGRGRIAKGFIEAAGQTGPSLAAMGLTLANPAAGAAATLALFGGSQFTETYEKALAAGRSTKEAFSLGLQTGGIEGFGETIADLMGAKFLKGGAQIIQKAFGNEGLEAAVQLAKDPRWAKRFGMDFAGNAAVQSGTEFGQGYGEAAVERNAGISNDDPLEQGLHGAEIAGYQSLLMAPLGIPGSMHASRQRAAAGKVIDDPAAPPDMRQRAAEVIHADITDRGVKKTDADAWLASMRDTIARESKPDQETAPTQSAPQSAQPSAPSAVGEHLPYAPASERTPYSQFNQENYGYSLPAAGAAFAVPATSRTVEGEVLGPLELPSGQKLLPQPPIDGESQRAYDLPRQMLENQEPPQPSVRQLATARGLLNHNPSTTPESIARLMRVDDGMAQQLYQMWQQSQGAKNGAESSNGRNAEVAAQGAQGGRGILPGGGNVLASASAGDTGRASDSSKVASPSMRPAVSAGVSGAEGVAAANQPKALNENAAKRQAVQLTNQGYPTVAFPHPSQSGMWAIGSPEDAQSVAATPRVETPPEQTRNGLTNSGRPSASWVIRNKTTGEVIMETFDRKKVDALNTEKYEAVPILEHLQGLNRQHSGAIAGKPVSDISSGMLAQIAGSNQPAAEKAKNEIARRASAQRITPLHDDRLEELSGYRHRLEQMADEFGWAEKGGRLLRDTDGNVSGRTPWIPHSDLWPGRPGNVSEKDARKYVQDVLDGKPLPAAGKRFITYLLDYQDNERKQAKEIESLDEGDRTEYDEVLELARVIVDEDSIEEAITRLGIQYENDDIAFYREATSYLKGIINDSKQRASKEVGRNDPGATGQNNDAGGAAARARPHEEAHRPDFQLNAHTREEVAAKDARAADESVAAKDQADQEREHFSLDGGVLPSESSGGTQAGLFTPDGRATQAVEAKTIAGKPVSEMSNDSLERIADGKSASDEAKGKAKEELNRRDAQSNPRTHGVNYADDFAIRPVEIIEHLISTGNINALYKAAGVKTVDAFSALPMDQRSMAYAQYVEDGGQPAPPATEAYNDKVARMEREALVRRLQSDATVLQANGKPFKTEVSAKEFSTRNELGDTHEVSKVDSGYVLKRLPEARRPSVIKAIEDRQANDPENQRQERAFSRAEKIGAAANEAVTAYENGDTSIEQFEAALDAAESANDKDHFTLERLNQSIAGKPVSEISDKTLEQIAKSSQPSAGKAKAEVARRQQEQNAVDKRIADAEASGIVLSESDKAAIRESLQKAETLNAKANSISIDPMNKGNAFPMGVGFTKITKRTEQRIDASVRRAGDAADLYKKAEVAEKHADALLSGKGTDADIAKKAEQRTEMQRNLIERLLNWKKGDKIGKFTVDRVSFDKDGYPSSYTISGDGIVKGVMDKTDVAREFFGGNKDTLRKLVDEMRVDQADSKHGEGRVEADGAPKTYTIAEHSETIDKLNSGTLTIDAYKDAFARARHGIDALKAEFSAMTKDQIMKTAGLSYQYKNDTKERIVRAAADDVLDSFDPREMKTWTMGTDRHGYISKVTQEDLTAYAERRKARIAEYAAEHKAAAEGAKNPQTIDDFRAFIGLRQREGMNFSEARMQLTPEQRARFDELMAESSRKARNYSDDRDSSVRVAAKTTEGQIVETKHTKTGEDLFVVKAAERVERDVFNQWNATAKKLGGWYSSYSSGGAVPGFQFKTRENAAAFLKYLGGNVDEAQSAIQERRDAFSDDRSQSAVERLNEMADRLDEQAGESLSVERKANTARRARFAASADASANADKALAKTMRNIATAIGDGSAKFLDRVRQKVQVEMLAGFLRTAKDAELRSKYQSYGDLEKHKGEPATAETADHAAFPYYTAYRSDLASLSRQLLQIEGTKKLGQRLAKVADDVTTAYTKFAKENLHKMGVFSLTDGRPARFSNKESAEAAISRSGFNGRAVVLQVKRGENVIIPSPDLARERGLWTGDDDKRITLSDEFGAELVEAIGRRANRMNQLSVPWQFQTAYDKRKRLSAIGIETPAEFRSALREFIGLQAAPKEADKIKQMERAMVGRKNDGLDFFPTPEAVSQEMIDAAEIKDGMSVLEPSAGMGHIAEQIRESGVDPDVVEMDANRRELLEAKGFNLVGRDFMEVSGEYDRIIMNPPFSNRRDAEHVQHAYALLKPGGRIVAIMGEGVFFGQDKKATEFREWLESVGGTSEKLEDGTFLDPSLPVNTGVNARMVVIDRKETDSGVAMFNAKSGSRGNPIDAAALESTIDRVISGSPSHFSRDTVVTASLFADLPAPILAKAKKEGYDSNGRKPNGEKLTGATYDGKVYLVQENISGELEAEETLLHERIHQIVHGNAKDPDGIALRQSLGKLYIRAGAKSGIERMAKEAGIDMTGPLAAFEKVAAVNRHAFLAEEFLAHAEGQRAYEKLPAKIRRAAREFWGEFRDWLRSSKFVRIAEALGAKLDDFTQSDLAWTLKGIRQQEAGTGSKVIRFMTAWHGSPHDHDGFDSSKIGTGEGAQAYGWGHYFAGAREVAEWYRNSLASGYSLRGKRGYEHSTEEINAVFKIARLLSQGTKEQMAINLVAAEARRDVDQGKLLLAENEANLGKKVDGGAGWGHIRHHTVTQEDVNEARDGLERAQKRLAVIEGIRPGDVVKNKGRLYQVELAPTEIEFLDWDKPFDEQSALVRNHLEHDVGVSHDWATVTGTNTGEDIYRSLSDEHGGDEAASKVLLLNGIRGIRYLDGSSRSAGKGNHNYVIFDDADVKITAKESRAANSDIQFAANVLSELTDHDELFRYPVSKSSNMKTVFAEVYPGAKYFGSGGSESVRTIQSIADKFKAQFKGASALDIRVVSTTQDIPPRFRPSPFAEGVFHDDAGLIYLVTANLRDQYGKVNESRAWQVLMHEAVGHFGLAKMMGDRFKGILKNVMQAARANGRVTSDIYRPGHADYATVEAVRLRYPDASDSEVAQEVLARMAETEPGRTLFGYVRAIVRQWLRDMARAAGFKVETTTAELNDLVAKASAYMRSGANLGSVYGSSGLVAASNRGLESRAHIVGDSGRYTAAQRKTFSNVGREVVTPTVKERIAEWTKDWKMRLAQGIADQFAPLKNLDDKAYMLSRMSKGADGALEAMMMYGRVFMRDGVYDVDVKDGGVIDKLLRPLGKEADDFVWWVAGNRAGELAKTGRENLMTPDDIKALMSLSDGKLDFDYTLPNGSTTRDRAEAYKAANEIMQQFNKSVMDIAEESGLIDGEARALWERDFYVPFYRDMEGDKPKFPNVKSGLVRQKAFERLNGGTEKLNSDLLANTLLNWSHLLHASAKNRAAKAALDAAERVGVAEHVDSSEKDSVSYRENGAEVHFKVNDPFILNSVTALEFSGFSGPAMRAMGAFKRWLTMGVTANPAFKVRNLIRDSISAIGTAELSYNILKNLEQGYAGTSKDSQTYASMLASGGVIRFGSMIEGNRADHVRQLTEKGIDPNTLIDDESKLKMVWNRYAMPLVEAYNELGDRSENINRAAIYEQLRAKGMSHAEASLQARDLMDFSMGGTWSAVRFLTQVVPFANARIQGLYKLGRSANEDPRRMGYVVGAVALASLALLAWYSDDDDWKKREDWDRDTYWWFKIGDTAFRIPKPFEIGAIGTLAERSAELLFDKEMDGERFGKRIGKMVSDTFSMNPTPQMFKPMIDLYANTDSFTGRPIESLGMEKLRPEDRFTTRSSEVAKAIGKAGVLSPVQIDHVIRGYFGWLGTAAVTSVDKIVRLGDDNPRPDMKLRDTFLIGNFVESLPAGSSRYVTQMYEQSKAVEEAYASFEHYLKSGDKEKAEQIYADEKDKIGKRLLMEHGKQTLTALNKQAKAIEENRQMSGEAKRAGLDRIESQKNAVAKRVMTAGL